tara:strand:+ start:968 stop:1108 length:141 start_codon:yes stop_codon:yes gene_type:complete
MLTYNEWHELNFCAEEQWDDHEAMLTYIEYVQGIITRNRQDNQNRS